MSYTKSVTFAEAQKLVERYSKFVYPDPSEQRVLDLAYTVVALHEQLEAVLELAREPIKRANSAAAEYDDFRFQHGRQNLAYDILRVLKEEL